jgi:hypothetical protein
MSLLKFVLTLFESESATLKRENGDDKRANPKNNIRAATVIEWQLQKRNRKSKIANHKLKCRRAARKGQ